MMAMPNLSLCVFAFLTLIPIIWNVDAGFCLLLLIAYCAAGVWVVRDVDEENRMSKNADTNASTHTATHTQFPSIFTKIKVDV